MTLKIAPVATAGTKHKPVDPINYANPFWLVISQSEARNVVTIHQGPDALAEAKAEASRRTTSTKRPAAVVGPQRSVFQPPKEPAVTEIQPGFDL
jgi:hypothetical protein